MALTTPRQPPADARRPDTRRQDARRQERRRQIRFRLLELDPELGQGLDSEQWRAASAAATARVFRHERGPWRFFLVPDPGAFGLLILDGLILVRLEFDGRGHLELLGEGDVVSPWMGMGSASALPTKVTAHVAADVRVAFLDREFAVRTAPWPELHGALIQRLIMRSRRLSLQSAINSLPRTEDRVELTLWQLAYRFGKVTPEGCKVLLRLTHSQLAEMVAAQRPSVSVALARLVADGRLERPSREQWLLCGPPPKQLSALGEENGLGPA